MGKDKKYNGGFCRSKPARGNHDDRDDDDDDHYDDDNHHDNLDEDDGDDDDKHNDEYEDRVGAERSRDSRVSVVAMIILSMTQMTTMTMMRLFILIMRKQHVSTSALERVPKTLGTLQVVRTYKGRHNHHHYSKVST